MRLWVKTVAIVGVGQAFGAAAAVAEPSTPPPPAKITLALPISTDTSGKAETTGGDVIADAVRDTAHADIALVPADEIAVDSLVPGSHPAADLLGLLSYGRDDTDTVVILKLTGKQLVHALERSVSREPQSFDGFFQISGLQLRYDSSRPIGKRIIQTGVPGETISDTKHYTVATTSPAANGSFGYFRVWDKSVVVSDTGVTVAKSLTDYATLRSILSPTIDGRIVDLWKPN